MEKHKFLSLIVWLHNINAKFGVDHVSIGGKIYWLDSESDIEKLYQMYKQEL